MSKETEHKQSKNDPHHKQTGGNGCVTEHTGTGPRSESPGILIKRKKK